MGNGEAYQGCIIEPQSSESDGDRWLPKALVRWGSADTLNTHPVLAAADVSFDTEQEANSYSVAMARQWIDDELRPPHG
jgi:hypothetical protein